MIDTNAMAPGVSIVTFHFCITGGVPMAFVESIEPSMAMELGPRRLI